MFLNLWSAPPTWPGICFCLPGVAPTRKFQCDIIAICQIFLGQAYAVISTWLGLIFRPWRLTDSIPCWIGSMAFKSNQCDIVIIIVIIIVMDPYSINFSLSSPSVVLKNPTNFNQDINTSIAMGEIWNEKTGLGLNSGAQWFHLLVL